MMAQSARGASYPTVSAGCRAEIDDWSRERIMYAVLLHAGRPFSVYAYEPYCLHALHAGVLYMRR